VTSQEDPAGSRGEQVPDMSGEPRSFDTSIAHSARMYDYWLGGKDNYAADREAAELALAANPNIAPGVRANRAFLRRAVQYLAGEAGIRQFLDIGTGLPTNENTHQVAQAVAPGCRVVYVDSDPIVLAHARALLTSAPEGATDYIEADARDTTAIVRTAARTLDFSQPVAVMMLLVLQYIPDSDRPRDVVSALMAAVPPGSYLTISDTTADIDGQRAARVAERLNTRMGPARLTMRSREQIAGFFDGLDLVEPGLVPLPQWRALFDPAELINAYAGLARKPAPATAAAGTTGTP
jgi:S-adenosyl methyltransferase